MGKKFTVNARAIIHLGRESIKNYTTALIELVKNSYDADADNVEIEIINSTEKQPGYIRICDDGEGMSVDDIDNKWLNIGFSFKSIEAISKKKGRRKTGEKGIGRLSADRLGSILEIRTRSVDIDDKSKINDFGLRINWEDFDNEKIQISDVILEELKDAVFTLPTKSSSNTGTELRILNLRDKWTKEDIENLYQELSILTSPFSEIKDFSINLKNNIDEAFNGNIEAEDYIKPEIEIELIYDGENNLVKYTIEDHIEGIIEKKTIDWKSLMLKVIDPFEYEFSESLKCGPVKVKLLLYPRTKALAEGVNLTLKDLKHFIDSNVGVKIYRDNISVKPYGYTNVQYGGDWLGIAERYQRNPAGINRKNYRVPSNQVVGAIFIGRDSNPLLKDSTSREGLVESNAYYDLRALALGGLALLEAKRHQIYKENKDLKKKISKDIQNQYFKDQIESFRKDLKEIENVENIPIEVKGFLTSIEGFLDFSEDTSVIFDEMLHHTRVLSGLATVGITSAVFAHETQSSIMAFNSAAEIAKDYLEFQEYDTVKEELTTALKYGKQVASWGSFTLSRVRSEKRKKIQKDINVLLEQLIKDIQKVFDVAGIEIKYDFQAVKALVFPMDIEAVFLNILTNAYSSCLTIPENRLITVKLFLETRNEVEGFTLIISNSGPPIDPNLLEWIWDPLNSLKKKAGKEVGTGLGLFIVRSTIESLNGMYKAVNNSNTNMVDFDLWVPLK